MAHTIGQFLGPRDQATRHALLPSSETHTLHGSAKQSTVSVLPSMPQIHTARESCSLGRAVSKSKIFLFSLVSSHALSTSHSSLGYYSATFPFLWGVACSPKPGKAGLLPACSCFRDVFPTFIADLGIQNGGKVHRGALHTGRIIPRP